MPIFRRTFVAAIFAVLCLALSAGAAEVNRIGVIDFQRIVETSEAGKAAQAQIKAEGERMDADLVERKKDAEELQKRIEREALVMDQAMREEKSREFRIAINDLKAREKKYQDDFKALNAKLVGRLQQEVIRLVKKVGKEGGYTLILDKRGSVIYSAESIDLTDQIIPMIPSGLVK